MWKRKTKLFDCKNEKKWDLKRVTKKHKIVVDISLKKYGLKKKLDI